MRARVYETVALYRLGQPKTQQSQHSGNQAHLSRILLAYKCLYFLFETGSLHIALAILELTVTTSIYTYPVRSYDVWDYLFTKLH